MRKIAKSKGMELILKLSAQIDRQLPASMKNLSEETKKLADRYKELKNAEKANNNYKKSREEYGKTIELYRKNRNELKRLEQAKNAGIKLSAREEKRYKQLIPAVDKLSRSVDKQRSTFQRYKLELGQQKIPLDQLQKELKETENAMKKLNAQQLINGKIGGLKQKAKNFGGRVVGAGLNLAKKAVIGAGAIGIAGGSYLGVQSAKTYLDFNANMKKVQAISGATGEEFAALEREAMRLGATTKFTAGESAAAMEKMALAGFSTTQIIAGMGGVLDLAAASGEDVAMVSDIITDNLTAFNMTADQTGRFADVLAWTMSKTNVNVQMLGESLKYIAGSASDLNIPLEEVAGTIGLMGDQAIKSGMAGRGMRSVFSSLLSKKDILKKVGINIEDKDGNFIGVAKTVELFEKRMKNMKGMDRSIFLNNVFGDMGKTAFSTLLRAEKTIDGVTYKGSQAVAKTIEAATKDSVGKAEEMREIMLEGASGAWTLLTSAWDGLKVTIGSRIFSKRNLYLIKVATSYISEFTNILNGSFNNSMANIFWQKFFISTKSFVGRFKKALEPAREVMKRLLPDQTEAEGLFMRFIKSIENGIIRLAETFSFLMQVLEPIINFINFIGIDNIIVFAGTFFTLTKALAGFLFLKGKIIGFIGVIKGVGGILAGIKTGALALGGPIIWIGTAIALAAYLIYKNWDLIKRKSLELSTAIKKLWADMDNSSLGRVIKFFLKFMTPIGQVIQGIRFLYDSWKILATDGAGALIDHLIELTDKYWYLLAPLGLILKFGRWIYENWEALKTGAGTVGKYILEFANKLSFLMLPMKYIISLGKKIYDNWDLMKSGIMDFATSVETSLSKAWDKISGFFGNVGDKIKNFPFVKKFLLDIDAEAKGKGVDGSHRNGLSYVPYDNYIARLHKGERVLTAPENDEYNRGTLFETLSKAKGTGNNYNNSTQEAIHLTYNPEINIQVGNNANTDDIIRELKKELENTKREITKMIKEMRNSNVDKARTDF